VRWRGKRHVVQLGRAQLVLLPGAKGSVGLRLSAAGRKLMSSRRRLPARLTVVAADDRKVSATTTGAATLVVR
jgi:hypothetical protein